VPHGQAHIIITLCRVGERQGSRLFHIHTGGCTVQQNYDSRHSTEVTELGSTACHSHNTTALRKEAVELRNSRAGCNTWVSDTALGTPAWINACRCACSTFDAQHHFLLTAGEVRARTANLQAQVQVITAQSQHNTNTTHLGTNEVSRLQLCLAR